MFVLVANSQKKSLKKLSPGDFAWHKNRQSLGQKCIGGGLGGLWGTCSKFNGATGPSGRQEIWLRSLNNKAKNKGQGAEEECEEVRTREKGQ